MWVVFFRRKKKLFRVLENWLIFKEKKMNGGDLKDLRNYKLVYCFEVLEFRLGVGVFRKLFFDYYGCCYDLEEVFDFYFIVFLYCKRVIIIFICF